jgi:membrane protein implicated in regulation of membrane protease activity
VSYRFEWIAAPVVFVPLFLLLIGPVAVIALVIVATAALAAAVALSGAVLALPYLLVRSLRRRIAERRPIRGATAQAETVKQQPGIAVLAIEGGS